jgi:uncharacterized protein
MAASSSKSRKLWRRWFGTPAAPARAAAPTEDAVEKQRVAWGKLAALLGSPVAESRNEYRMPDIMPGVLPKSLPTGANLKLAMDEGGQEVERMALDNAMPAAWGFTGTGNLGPGLAFLGFPYLAELVQISEYRIPSESLSTEMTRRWMKLKNKGKRDLTQKIHDLTERMEQLKVRDLFREAALKTEQFGRAHIYVSVKGQDDDLNRQLPLTEVKKGTLLGFSCIEPYWLTPYSWNATHPERKDFYKPQSWFVLGRKTHESRLLTFIFREVPDLLKPAYDFAGISMTQLMMPYVQRWLRTAKNVNDLINIFSIVTLATDLQTLLQDPVEFVKRLQLFTQGRDNRGVMAINKATEELSVNDVTLGSLDKLQAQSQEHMATPGRMPLIKFFGITPTGLNASSEGEFQSWYDYAHALQELGYSPHMEKVVNIVQMDLYGTVDSDITHEWLSLYEPIGKDKADIRKSDADRDSAYITAGVVSPDEVRKRLQLDPESGYDGLEGDAPEPPSMQEIRAGSEQDDDDDEDGPPGKPSKGPPKN